MIRILHQVSKHLILVWQWIVPGMISFNVHHLIDHTVGLILGSSDVNIMNPFFLVRNKHHFSVFPA